MKTGFYNKYKDLIFAIIIITVSVSFVTGDDRHLTEAILMFSIGFAYLLSFVQNRIKNKKLSLILSITSVVLLLTVVSFVILRRLLN